MKTIARKFQIGPETKTDICVAIPGTKEDKIFTAWLPKNQITITNRIYGFGGSKTADITFPKTLIALFK